MWHGSRLPPAGKNKQDHGSSGTCKPLSKVKAERVCAASNNHAIFVAITSYNASLPPAGPHVKCRAGDEGVPFSWQVSVGFAAPEHRRRPGAETRGGGSEAEPPPALRRGYDDRENDLFLCDTNTCKFDGECLRIGDSVTCVCQFKCNNDYVPVCGSNGDTYQNECYLKQAACKQQSEILLVSEGSCATDAGSGSGDGVNEGSGETNQKETSTCDICQFGAECDEDAEDVWCVCNIDCSQTNFNPLCASDGKSYDNACQIKEASCQKQEKIEVMSLGRCQDNTTTTTKSEDGHYARTDYAENANKLEESARGIYIPCPEHYNGFCMHGKCEHSTNMLEPSCRCDAGYTGQHCEKKDYSVLYVVPGPVRFQYVLIAAVIGTIQIAIICVVVLCITRKCPRSNRIHRQKQNTGHYSSDNTTRASTRLI
ncbi:transmembrane protein with EGF-like and two follistatin-like domains 2 [Columba livia]|uniref:Tomoregulin-2 n=116 Tax=Aves TaxID=8782 RepID=A0A2I0MID7_COLLI|nr:transmembrane protein with EGF-like and two follistatin-like domains 2 [Columba livia]